MFDVSKMGNIQNNLRANNNIIANPCVVYSKNFLISNKYLEDEISYEYLNLWKK